MLPMATEKRSTRRFIQTFMLLALLSLLPAIVQAAGLPAPDIEELRQQIKENGWSFQVSDQFSSTITPEERLNLRSGFVMTDADVREMEQHLTILPLNRDPLPSSLDWRDVGGITPVKNQGSCGSCWAFAATAQMEAYIKIYYGVEMDLSEQQSVSCNPYGAGCDGGWASASYYVFQQQGAVTEACMPYLSMDPPGAPCIESGLKKYGYVTGYNYISNNVEQIKAALQNGPVCTGIDASDAFEAYGSGCFDEISFSTNHLVLIVGYDDRSCGEEGAWIIKNSWGPGFGEGGYITVKYGAANTGSSVTQLQYVAPPVSIDLTGGINGAELIGGEIRDLTWETSGAAVSNVDIWLGIEGHCHDTLVASNVPNTGAYSWEVPNASTNYASLVIHPTDGGTEEGYGITSDPIKIIGHQTRYVSALGSNTAPFETPATAAHTIVDALNACTGVDSVLVTAGTYNGMLTISGPVTLIGGYNSDFSIRNSHENITRVVSGETGLRFLAGSGDLGSVDGVLFEGCAAGISAEPVGGQHGGAIFVSGCSPIISNCDFINNRAHPGSGLGYGGAICVNGGQPVIQSCSFQNNTASKGGAIGIFNGASIIINESVFDGSLCTDATSENVGGAIYAENSTLEMNTGSITNSSFTYQGSGIYASAANVYLADVDISGNQAINNGGAIFAAGGYLGMSGCRVDGNESTSGSGGAIYCTDVDLAFTNSRFMNNHSIIFGGGLGAMNASGKIENCLFSGNVSANSAGLMVVATGDFNLRNNIITGNNGGGLLAAGELMVADFNNVVNNLPSDYSSSTAGSHDISLAPVFVNEAEGDFGLAQFSPCIDAGQDDASCLDPDGSRADMGLLGGPGSDFVAPAFVTGAALLQLGEGQVRVTWDASGEDNISHYVVYRDTAAVFVPTALRAVATVDHPTTVFEDLAPVNSYYLVVAVDEDGYSSGYSQRVYSSSDLTPVSDGNAPRVLAITGVVPNPFNPMANVKFDLPRSGRVQLSVFDLRGRLVRELVSGQMEAGNHEVMWNGRDSRGQMSATGVYFARLSSADGVKTVKMVLAK